MNFNQLVSMVSPDLIKKESRVKLMRHQFKSDIEILKTNKSRKFNDDEISDFDALRQSTLTTEDKLATLRTDLKLAEISISELGGDRLNNTDVAFVFVATERKCSEFIGAFKIMGPSTIDDFIYKYSGYLNDPAPMIAKEWHINKYIPQLGYSKWISERSFYYDVELLDDPINQYINRVIVDWPSPINWVQSDLNKEIVEIRPKGFVRAFTDYYDFVLPFTELKKICDNPDGNQVWYNKLSAISGVYLITDHNSGQQYIGSAYGNDGIWGRWKSYANTIHGNNKSLVELIREKGESYRLNLRISILRVMDKTASKADVIAAESFLKLKLGTREHGLNNN